MNCEIEIVQCAREIRSGGGVSGVAYALENEFKKKGIKTLRFTSKDVGISDRRVERSFFRKKLKLLCDVVVYSVVGSIKLFGKKRREKGKIIFCHSDVMFGDVYINHGLHRAMLFSSPSPFRMMIRNPIHLFLLIREWVRFNIFVPKRIVCFSQSDASELLSVYPKAKSRISLIPNGVDVVRFSVDLCSRKRIRQELGILEYEFVIIFVGHEFERKGLRFILEAMPHVCSGVRLLVVGGGGEQEVRRFKSLSEQLGVDERVLFLGVRSDIPGLMNASDAFILPTYYEAWPLVGLEAMACGLPALMTPVAGIPEFLENGINGLFIDRNSKDVASKINLLLSDSDNLARMKTKARDVALGYSWEKISEKYLELAREIQEEKKKFA
ncbi:glycosyltransferase family 4 protein [Salinicola salarius]|uniref:glycosyltransferase family 4 protein n=1 Tax=Salinicola salarius TaxID=430457 RepID=UPI00130026FD|nr:glycosyltransferase family 4 protein [Salinicola salarius]